jgi:hypothetical protein
MMVTNRSSSSELSSPALWIQAKGTVSLEYHMYVPLIEIDIGLFAHQVRVPAANTLDLSQGIHDLPLSIYVGIKETQDVLELLMGFRDDQ